jgi:hypothetical protein
MRIGGLASGKPLQRNDDSYQLVRDDLGGRNLFRPYNRNFKINITYFATATGTIVE